MARLQSAMVPVLPEDGAPLVRPRSVTVASVLVMIAGVLFLLIGERAVALNSVIQATQPESAAPTTTET